MIASTRGWARHSHVLGFHRDDVSRMSEVCPELALTGECTAHQRELQIRRQVAEAREAQLRARASTMYELQVEMLAHYSTDGTMTEAEARALVGSGFTPAAAERERMIARLVEELKQEPEYQHWNMEADVEEQLVLLKMRRCPFSHRAEVNRAVKRNREEMEGEGEGEGEAGGPSARQQREHWDDERRRVFANLTPFQRCVACLVWQGSVRVPQRLCCNVRVELEKREEARRRAAGADPAEVDAHLGSEEFAALVAVEEERLVPRVVCRPALGHFDLSSINRIVSHVSRDPDAGVIAAETVAYFASPPPGPAAAALVTGVLTEKELDLGGAQRAEELAEVLEWMVQLFNTEMHRFGCRSFHPDGAPPPRVVLRSLVLRACDMAAAEPLVASLHKRHAERTLLALDLSDNRLHSLRFLFSLRAHFSERLLRLSLKNNAITRKPEYQEQVRRCLPRLTSLDGEPIRRPPLPQPRPLPASHTLTAPGLPEREVALVLDTLARFFYAWETRYVPRTALELRARREEGAADPSEEEELSDDNFPYRYLHPSATFTVAAAAGLAFFDPRTMRLAREVELDAGYDGMRLSPIDMKELRVFDVVVRNSSRNLVAGRAALSRTVKGPQDCFAAYQLALYPERMEVDHHFGSAAVSITRIDTAANRGGGKKGQAPSAFGGSVFDTVPRYYLITVHGTMTWRLPSMKRGECLQAAYTRTLTLADKIIARSNYDWERRRSPKLVVLNDMMQLRPPTESPAGLYAAQTAERHARLVVEFGLEGCADAAAMVRAVMERSTSDAAESAALDVLVFGPPPLPTSSSSSSSEQEEAEAEGERVFPSAEAVQHFTTLVNEWVETAAEGWSITSLLDRPNPLRLESKLYQEEDEEEIEMKKMRKGSSSEVEGRGWGSTTHTVSLPFLCQVVAAANRYCTAHF